MKPIKPMKRTVPPEQQTITAGRANSRRRSQTVDTDGLSTVGLSTVGLSTVGLSTVGSQLPVARHMRWQRVVIGTAVLAVFSLLPIAVAKEPVPDKLVVLTFDDSAKSHFTVARPILLDHGFGATFFITEGFDFPTNKTDYMTWDEIRQLHQDGFEIGNHTRDHLGISDAKVDKLPEQLDGIDVQCRKHNIPIPVSFAWPGNATSHKAFELLKARGIKFARRGGAPEYPYENGRGFAFEPGKDHPLLLPSAGDARPDWNLADFIRAVEQAKDGRIAILQFHGVPDTAHSWVNSPREKFELYMKYLSLNNYKVIALRDLQKYVDADLVPEDAEAIIKARQAEVAKSLQPDPEQ